MTAPAITTATWNLVSSYLKERTGLHFPPSNPRDLEHKLSNAVREFGRKDIDDLAQWILTSSLAKSDLDRLVGYLTIGETFFFRDGTSMEAIKDRVAPELIARHRKGDRRLRIWSAGCATGEEPYSLAILLHRLIPDIETWDITIMATDINARFLARAEEGVYTKWSFRGTPRWVREEYFTKLDDHRFAINAPIREMVTFAYINLSEDSYPSLMNNTNGMDLILCRNVLMYFDQEYARTAADRFYRALVDEGWLIVSAVETSQSLFSRFSAVRFADVTFYRKGDDSPGETPQMKQPKSVTAPKAAPPAPARITAKKRLSESTAPAGLKLIKNGGLSLKGEKAESEPSAALLETIQNLYRQGRYGEAEAAMSRRLSDASPDPAILSIMARIKANQGKLEEALQWCERTIAADKMNPRWRYLMASVLDEQGVSAEATAACKKALYLDGDFLLAHFSLGNIALKSKRKEEARRHFKTLRKILIRMDAETIVPESEGLSAKRLLEILDALGGKNNSEEGAGRNGRTRHETISHG